MPDAGHGDSQTLQLATRALADLTLHQLLKLKHAHQVLPSVLALRLLVEDPLQRGVRHLDAPRDLVNILRLGDGLDVVFEHLGEEILQLATTVVLQNLCPLGRVVEATEVGLELASQDLERSTLADSVGTNETENLTGTRSWQPVQLERVGAVAVRDMRFEVGRQVENGDSLKGTPVISAIDR